MSMTEGKQLLVEKKDTMCLHDDGNLDKDSMPLISFAWDQSFAQVDKNKKTISNRYWNPLN